jgi:hypothetical protein
MSTTYSLVCHDCQIRHTAGKSSGFGDYQELGNEGLFLFNHVGHKVELIDDSVEPCDIYFYDTVTVMVTDVQKRVHQLSEEEKLKLIRGNVSAFGINMINSLLMNDKR